MGKQIGALRHGHAREIQGEFPPCREEGLPSLHPTACGRIFSLAKNDIYAAQYKTCWSYKKLISELDLVIKFPGKPLSFNK